MGATDTFDGRAVALADLWNRGALDVVVANQRGPLLVYRNRVDPARHWIQFELEGTASNRAAIGARVELQWSGGTQVQEVMAASGFSAQNARRLHFGLGTHTTVERATVRWPSGQVQTIAFHLWSGTLRLTLRTAAGAPAHGIAPCFWNRTARVNYVHNLRTDQHGVVEVELSAGDYEVQLGDLGEEGTTIGTVAIRPGERAEARLSLPR